MLAGVKHAAEIAVLFGQLLDVLDNPFMGLDRSTRRKRRKPPTRRSEARGRFSAEPDQEEQKDRGASIVMIVLQILHLCAIPQLTENA
jgi:hypothetical protein